MAGKSSKKQSASSSPDSKREWWQVWKTREERAAEKAAKRAEVVAQGKREMDRIQERLSVEKQFGVRRGAGKRKGEDG